MALSYTILAIFLTKRKGVKNLRGRGQENHLSPNWLFLGGGDGGEERGGGERRRRLRGPVS